MEDETTVVDGTETEQEVNTNESVNQDTSEETTQLGNEQSSTEAGQEEESGAEGTEGANKKTEEAAKTFYAPEEVEALLKTDGVIDTSRLTPEGKVLMKSFQKGYTNKFQEIAGMRKHLESQINQLSQKATPDNPEEAYFQKYMQNQQGAVAEFNSKIADLMSIPFDDERYPEAQKSIAYLTSKKDEFALKRQAIIDSNKFVNDVANEAHVEILKDIPDFSKKAEALTSFASSFGLTREDAMLISDPTTMVMTSRGLMPLGNVAVRLTKAINKIYDKLNAGKTADKKEVKKSPPQLNRAGSGSDTTVKKTDFKAVDDDKFEKMIADAKNGVLKI